MDRVKEFYIPLIVDIANGKSHDEFDPVWLEETFADLRTHINEHYKRPEGQYSKVRKLISAHISHPQILQQLRASVKMTKDQFELANHAARKVLELKNSRQTVISFLFVNSVVNRVRSCISFADKFVLLQLACGARKVELLDASTSTFVAVPHQRRLIEQRGFAKKRDEVAHSIVKPLLWIDSDTFLTCLSEIRGEVDKRGKQGREAIAKSFSTQLERHCHLLWPMNPMNGYRTGTHLNRAIYANVAYHFRKGPGQSLTKFIKHQLGHDSMGSAANYMNVAIAFAEDDLLVEEAKWQEGVPVDGGVEFESSTGEQVFIDKPPMRHLDLAQRHQELWNYRALLEERGVEVSRSTLMRLGFQSRLITSSDVLSEE